MICLPRDFYPRSPCGERHQILEDTSGATNHFYPRSPCGERLVILRKRDTPLTISIHALLAESDRPPGNSCGTIYLHFYPRSPCGERRMMKLFSQLSTDISIHALLAESDRCCPCAIIAPAISIHALLAESDLLPFAMTITALDFYPRSPCGERHTRGQGAPLGVPYFYPRSPCGERLSARCAAPYPYFYPRSPCGERPGSVSGISSKTAISIHALLAESDNQSKHFERSK